MRPPVTAVDYRSVSRLLQRIRILDSKLMSTGYLCLQEMQGNCSPEESSSSAAAPEAMEERLWENLPQELVGRMLPWLPITSVLRSHTLCKEFHSWLSTTSFLIDYARVPSRPPWLLVFPDAKSSASAYDPSSDAWLHLPFTFLPFEIRPLAAARGLVCVMPKRGICSSSLFLCNPVTRSWAELPRPQVLSRFFFLVVAMSVSSAAFTIVVAGSELVSEHSASFNLTAEVFDSRAWSWRRGGSLFVETPISPCKAISSGRLFVVAGTKPPGIIAYDLEHGLWSRIEAPVPSSRPLVSMKLVDRMGSLIMVGGIGHQGADDYDICIWELEPGRCEWRELDRMPAPFRNELLKPMSRRFACLGDGDVIYFSSKKCPSILVYRFSSRIWKWASCCNSENPHYDMLRGVCFEPRLDANPHHCCS